MVAGCGGIVGAVAGVVGAGVAAVAAGVDAGVAVVAAMAEEDEDAVAFALLALSTAGFVARLRFVPPGDLLIMLAVRLDSGAVVLKADRSALHRPKPACTHLATGIAQSTISTSDCELVGVGPAVSASSWSKIVDM